MADVTADGPAPEWQPIDSLLAAACDQLGIGEAVQSETFSLFEAMSAVEVGNPKMDSTALPAIASCKELLQQGSAPVDLSPDQQLAVMERLLLLESSHYFLGAPLAASVYSSLYMMKTSRLMDTCPMLFAFCEGVEETCRAVRWLVFHGTVSEEEDFNLLVMGLPCEIGVPPNGVAPIESKCIFFLESAIRTASDLAASEPEHAATYTAIIHRLTLRKELHLALVQLHIKSEASLTACGKHLAAALKALAKCEESAVTAEELDSAPGFVEGLNRHLLGPAPPRVIQLSAREAAYSSLKTLLTQLQAALEVTEATTFRDVHVFLEKYAALNAGPIARSAAHYLVSGKAWAAAASLPAPTITDNASKDAADKSTTTASSCPWSLDRPLLCEALALPQKPPICEEVELFIEQALIAIGNWAQSMLLNPCRQRRRLRRGLDDWGNLFQHAINADLSPAFQAWMKKNKWVWVQGQAGQPHPVTGEPDPQGPLATWVAAYIAYCGARHLTLGFPLDLYSPPEYGPIYWYCSSLLNSRREDLQMLLKVNAPVPTTQGPSLPAARGKSRPPKLSTTGSAKPSPATAKRLAGIAADAVHVEVHASMCSAIVRLLLGLEKAGLIKQPQLPFNTLAERFDQRFACFHAPTLIKPIPLNYGHYCQATDIPDVSARDFLAMAAESFALVRRGYANVKTQLASTNAPIYLKSLSDEQVSDLAAIDKVANINGLAANLVLHALENKKPEEALPIITSFDFSQHKVFPALKVKTVGSTTKLK